MTLPTPSLTMKSWFFTASEVYPCHYFPNRFTINSTTGVISTKAGLDHEDEMSYTVTVTATDQDPDEDARRSQAVQVTIAGETEGR